VAGQINVSSDVHRVVACDCLVAFAMATIGIREHFGEESDLLPTLLPCATLGRFYLALFFSTLTSFLDDSVSPVVLGDPLRHIGQLLVLYLCQRS
jgi:hypothetical protein